MKETIGKSFSKPLFFREIREGSRERVVIFPRGRQEDGVAFFIGPNPNRVSRGFNWSIDQIEQLGNCRKVSRRQAEKVFSKNRMIHFLAYKGPLISYMPI